jgi:hypothetical protein
MHLALLTSWLLGACLSRYGACTCFPPRDPRTPAEARSYVEGAAAVFEGTVLRTAMPTLAETRDTVRRGLLIVTLRVHRQWRGDMADTIVVTTPLQVTMCGADFEVGRTYFVIADAVEFLPQPAWLRAPWMSARSCGTTRLARQARAVERLLDAR